MKVLVVGGGGREHALAWRLDRDPSVETVVAAPGNPGIAQLGRCFPVGLDDTQGLVDLALRVAADLTVIGPEAPLVGGLADRLRAAGLVVCGPGAAAARLEGSKAFAKRFMLEHGIPTAPGRVFDDAGQARTFLITRGAPSVIKADGLAAGKGVHVCADVEAGLAAIDRLMLDGAHGDAGRRVVIEELLEGEEASVFCVTDGERYVVLPTSQDHKRLLDGDRGPMTGGMGAVAPAPIVTPAVLERVCSEVIEPTLAGLRAQESRYSGFLYVGLMIRDGAARVLEYNCRLGDPEAQAVLPLIGGDVSALLLGAARGDLGAHRRVETVAGASACVVIAAPGYPDRPVRGLPITGLDGQDDNRGDVIVFHAGTAVGAEGRLVTAGGRVLGVTGLGPNLETALERANGAIGSIELEDMQWRRDIGRRALARLEATPANR